MPLSLKIVCSLALLSLFVAWFIEYLEAWETYGSVRRVCETLFLLLAAGGLGLVTFDVWRQL